MEDLINHLGRLLEIEYYFVLGRKGKQIEVKLNFDKKDFFHLMGLQKCKDISELKQDRGKIFDELLKGNLYDKIKKSVFYKSIEDRLFYLINLEELIDSNNTIFKYNQKLFKYSKIEARFLLENTISERILYLFLDSIDEKNFFCRSFFPKGNMDYARNQPEWKVLRKEKKNTRTGEIFSLC